MLDTQTKTLMLKSISKGPAVVRIESQELATTAWARHTEAGNQKAMVNLVLGSAAIRKRPEEQWPSAAKSQEPC